MSTPDDPASLPEALEEAGFVIVRDVVSVERISEFREATAVLSSAQADAVLRRGDEVYGVRDLIGRSPAVRELAASPEILRWIWPVLGPRASVVRGLFFDKTPGANWNLPWHQDLTIAVRERRDVPGFGPWTLKAGIPHVHAPGTLLGRMVTIRIHLDDCGPDNGPMRVLPGSHSRGRLAPADVARWTARSGETSRDCIVPAGGAVIMRPLILHASAAATAEGHRRVIHLEYAAEDLPGGLEWYRAACPMTS